VKVGVQGNRYRLLASECRRARNDLALLSATPSANAMLLIQIFRRRFEIWRCKVVIAGRVASVDFVGDKVMARHVYRKAYQHQFEAEESAQGFAMMGNIDKPGITKAWAQKGGGAFYVYVELEGEMDPEELLAATGFERVS
jgi:hypothetical protein